MDWKSTLNGKPKARGPALEKLWNINDPKDAREFLADFRDAKSGKGIKRVQVKSGEIKPLIAITDEEAVQVANKLFDELQKQRMARVAPQA